MKVEVEAEAGEPLPKVAVTLCDPQGKLGALDWEELLKECQLKVVLVQGERTCKSM